MINHGGKKSHKRKKATGSNEPATVSKQRRRGEFCLSMFILRIFRNGYISDFFFFPLRI